MNILVTGATGFIGSRLCEVLHEAGYRVSVLSRHPASARRRVPSLGDVFPWNSVDTPPPAEALDRVHGVIHLPGERINGPWSPAKRSGPSWIAVSWAPIILSKGSTRWVVMTLALLIYSVAQRRMRTQLQKQEEILPNPIGQPTSTPTLRWIFQLLDGIHRVRLYVEGHLRIFIEGLTDLQRKILRLFGQTVCQLYQISSP